MSKGGNKFKNNYALEVKIVGMTINAVIRFSMGDWSIKLSVDGTGEIIDNR